MKILMFGTGEICDIVKKKFNVDDSDILGYIESKRQMDIICGKPVYEVPEIKGLKFDYIYVTNSYFVTVLELLDANVEKKKIVLCNVKLYAEYIKKFGHMDVHYMLPGVITAGYYNAEIIGTELLKFHDGYNDVYYAEDYCRVGTLQLLANEIVRNSVVGDTAELGVYKGDFAKYINVLLPDRNMLLFDTFEGFNDEDILEQSKQGLGIVHNIKSDCIDTSEDLVLSKMINKFGIEIRKGYFPKTIPQEEHIFSFVSIDCDLFQPILEGLRYFYPRLARGGIS